MDLRKWARVLTIRTSLGQYMQYSGDSNQLTGVVVWLSPSFRFVSIDDEFHDSRTNYFRPPPVKGRECRLANHHQKSSSRALDQPRARNLIHPMHPPLRFMISSLFAQGISTYWYNTLHLSANPQNERTSLEVATRTW